MMSLTESSPPPPPPPPPPTTITKRSLLDNDHINNNNKSRDNDDHDLLISQLPKTKGFLLGPNSSLTLYQNFWCPSAVVRNVVAFQAHFRAQNQDIVVASYPKSGTTWLKALVFSIVNRARHTPSDTPLLSSNPHQLVPFAEFILYAGGPKSPPDLNAVPPPRLLATHVPYPSLPGCLTSNDSKSRIIYVCRNPLDVVVSSWHFAARDYPERCLGWTMEAYVDKFRKGETGFGPYWAHVIGFWRASQENPKKVLFLRYEDMKRDTLAEVKRIAEFIGFPFSEEEESGGVIKEIIELCSLGRLKELEVNKSGKYSANFDNKSFFRKGEVGDWVNYLTPSLAESINKVIEEKMNGSGLTFNYNI